MPTTIVGNGSPGAGRVYDAMWPRPIAASTVGMTRLGADFANLTNSTGAGGAVSGPTRYRGRWCYYTAAAAAAGASLNWNGIVPQPMTVRSSGNLAGADDTLCIRYIFIMAFSDCADIGVIDSGCQVVAGSNPQYLNANTALGFGFQRRSTNNVRLLVRNVAGVVPFAVDQAVPGIVTADWNAYEFRYIGPTDQREGQLKCYVNSRNVANFSFGTATPPPEAERAGPFYGWIPLMVNWQNAIAAQTLYYGQMRVIIGPTEQSLL